MFAEACRRFELTKVEGKNEEGLTQVDENCKH